MGPSASVVIAPEHRLRAPWLREVLETVAEFQTASAGLVAWELCLPEDAVAPAWQQAVAEGLLEEAGRCSETSEMMFQLSPTAAGQTPVARRLPAV
jgi:hypothetical protein